MKFSLILIALPFTFAVDSFDVLQALGDLANIRPSTSLEGASAKICWKDLLQASISPLLETNNDVHYESCKPGYQSFGSFCIGKDLPAYKREVLDLTMAGICPAQFLKVENTCVSQNCPRELPANCGLLCAKDSRSCTIETTKVSNIVLVLLDQLLDKNWPDAYKSIRELYALLASWPSCYRYNHVDFNVDFNKLLDLVRQVV